MRWPDPVGVIPGSGALRELAGRFAQTADRHDRDGTFPFANYRALHDVGYLGRSIPAAFGGPGDAIAPLCRLQAILGQGDPSTGLAVAMHLLFMGRVGHAIVDGDAGEAGGWDAARYAHVADAVLREGVLINSAATEPEIGSPSRGGRPSTRARIQPSGEVEVTGRKTFTTGSPLLRFVVVSASLEAPDGDPDGARMAQVMVDRGTPRFDEAGVATFDDPLGLSIIETWDALGMRASGSHDLVLEAVRLPEGSVISTKPFGARAPAVAPSTEVAPPPPSTSGAGWALLVPSVYLGVARAARDAAVAFARDRRPEPMGGASIGSLPSVQRTLGEIEVHLAQAEATLFGAAEAWDAASSADRATFAPVLAVAKHVASNQSVAVADLAMRVVGGAGLARSHPVQRHYRDVRASLHHPPMDDVALATLARAALTEA